jgi:signal transduction histidine kinase
VRRLSEANAERLMNTIATGHVAAQATQMLALSCALAEVDTVADVTDVILGLGVDVVGATCGLIGRTDRGEARGIRVRGYEPAAEARVLSTALGESSPLGVSIASGKPIFLSSAREYQSRFPVDYQEIGVASRAQAHAALPLIHRDVLIGGLALGFGRPIVFSDRERAFLSCLAQAAASALARAIQCDAERARQRDCEVLARKRIEMLGVVAHDLRNPLNLIQITTEMLRDSALSAAMRDAMLNRCIRATKQMNRLIEDLLDATHLQAGGLRLELGPVELSELMSQVHDAYSPLAQERGVAWDVSGPDVSRCVRLDAARVLQAVGNLVGNALKFTPAGGRVTVRASVTSHDVGIAVSDTGEGMPADAVTRVFEPFWQVTADRRGIGLGLTIAKGIAEAHGGRIAIETTQGVGSTFLLLLPIAPAATDAISASAGVIGPAGRSASVGHE